jgi:hypothetical protein
LPDGCYIGGLSARPVEGTRQSGAAMRFLRPDIAIAVLLLGAGLIIAETAAVAKGASPLAFIENIYKPYRNSSSARGVDYSRPEVIRKHFAPLLAKAMVKDFAAAKKRGEVPALNGDPFIDAQDWEIGELKIEVKDTGHRRAVGVVTFTNASEPRTVTLDLIKTASGWRIADISAPSGSLRELYQIK